MVGSGRTLRAFGLCFIVAVAAAAGCSKEQPTPADTMPLGTGTNTATGTIPPRFQPSPGPLELGQGEAGAVEPLQRVYFDYDSTTLSADARATLQENYQWLKVNSTSRIEVEGHCDERGTNEYNMALGQRRAQSVKSYLVQLGVPASRIETISYGEELPADSSGTEAAFAKNRRAQFRLLSN